MSIDRSYYRTTVLDPESSLPLYVLDTTFFPQNDDPCFLDAVLNIYPETPHTLIIFTNGVKQIDLLRFIKSPYLRKIYLVHGNWLIKGIADVLTKLTINPSSPKPTIVNCENISSLAKFVDITKLPISLHTYLIDKIQYKNQRIIINRHFDPLYGQPLSMYTSNKLPLTQFQRIYNNLVAYLSNPSLDIQLTASDWTTIIQCSALDNQTKISIDILSECLKRDQKVILSEYSFLEHYMIIIKFILKLSNSNNPLIPAQLLIDTNVNFKKCKSVNKFFNDILTHTHQLLDKSQFQHMECYDNSYILVKIFKLFKFLLNKLQRETLILEPNAKNVSKSKDRQSLRLILSFTKILYTDNEEDLTSQDDDDIGFDNLFKLIRYVMEEFDNLSILGTQYRLDDFNNHISMEDFLAFEIFKDKLLGRENESNLIHPPTIKEPGSPVKLSKTAKDISAPPTPTPFPEATPPMPRNTKLSDSMESEIDKVAASVESLGLNDIDLYKTPKKSTNGDVMNDLLTPLPATQTLASPMHGTSVVKNTNLRKYTEKDLAVQLQAEAARKAELLKREQAIEVERGVRRGERKVSRLARLYEEKYMQ